ncbi:hypothetical protein, partial [Bacillus thuringiensis]|uniref:hypothetical protein n=1 Tax=Bacillus thuringiensis TaxID=1428 RepID=UPI001C92FFCB
MKLFKLCLYDNKFKQQGKVLIYTVIPCVASFYSQKEAFCMSEAIQLSQIETYIEEWHECYLSELKK